MDYDSPILRNVYGIGVIGGYFVKGNAGVPKHGAKLLLEGHIAILLPVMDEENFSGIGGNRLWIYCLNEVRAKKKNRDKANPYEFHVRCSYYKGITP
jgi:hypothetical protein